MFEKLKELGCDITPCGSRVTCNPAPTDTDADYLVFVKKPTDKKLKVLISDIDTLLDREGFVNQSDGDHYQFEIEEVFASYRKGEINLIVSANEDFIKRHIIATLVCKKLNLMDKKDRVMLFQAFLYDKAPE